MWRRLGPLLELQPEARLKRRSPKIIQVDGFYVEYPSVKKHRHLSWATKQSCVLLWAIDYETAKPVAWRFYDRLEDPTCWRDFVKYIKRIGIKPNYVVYDGSIGAEMAFKKYLSKCTRQRCLVHIQSNMNKDLGVSPRTELAKRVRRLGMELARLKNMEDLQVWADDWESLCASDGHRIRSLRTQSVDGLPKSLYSAFSVIHNTYTSGELMAFLQAKGLPSNTNLIESLNGNLREILSRHRGMALVKRQNLLAWYLALKYYSLEELSEMVKNTLFET
jgi:hypothetical protein